MADDEVKPPLVEDLSEQVELWPCVNDGDWLRQTMPRLHKDFYLQNADPMLQSDEYCWGNLEAAHPVLGKRTKAEADEFRRKHGIVTVVVRGRLPPKPFQTFQETSFPRFVEDVAIDLFTAEALPFPVQAQAWPCALAGFDVVAVAPTGSGKTLAFLLPGLVHIMAQPPIQVGEGPIAIILSPTRELAQQTLSVAQRFCERTSGEDKLRSGAVWGGIHPSLQVPSREAPDFSRWPEMLVATPGRLLELLARRRWMSAKRISYVVLDEADQLLSSSMWLSQVHAILRLFRSDRQLLLFSATWPAEAEAAANELCGKELIKIRVDPEIPCIPQDVILFPGASHDSGVDLKLDALVSWLRTDFGAHESLLILCQNFGSARNVLNHDALLQAVSPESTGQDAQQQIALLDSGAPETQHATYLRFVRGEIRVLISTFRLGGRGLDFADTTGAANNKAKPLSLAVLLFDFPNNIKDYAHCIGRTARPGQDAGRAISFLPEHRFWITSELISLLEHCKQSVPQTLLDQYREDRNFVKEIRCGMCELLNGGPEAGGEIRSYSGDFDAAAGVWVLPASLPSYRRKLLHFLADELDLTHCSNGEGDQRRLHIARNREDLPGAFFVEGEQVQIRLRGGGFERAIVVNAKPDRRKSTIWVRYHKRSDQAEVSIQHVRPFVAGTQWPDQKK